MLLNSELGYVFFSPQASFYDTLPLNSGLGLFFRVFSSVLLRSLAADFRAWGHRFSSPTVFPCQTPSVYAGGTQKMNPTLSEGSRQPPRKPWSLERLRFERSIAVGAAIDTSTHSSYTSALNSYVYFCDVHGFPYKPTPDTFSFYIVWLCNNDVQRIDPKSVEKYLSGICNELEDFYDDVRAIRNHRLVRKTLKGRRRLYSKATKRKSPLSTSDLVLAVECYGHSRHHDDLLFLALLLTSWFGLLRSAELCLPDVKKHQNLRKRTRRDSVK